MATAAKVNRVRQTTKEVKVGRGQHPNSAKARLAANERRKAAAALGIKTGKKPRPSEQQFRKMDLARLRDQGLAGEGEPDELVELLIGVRYELKYTARTSLDRSRLRTHQLELLDRIKKRRPNPKVKQIVPRCDPPRLWDRNLRLARHGAFGPEAMRQVGLLDQVLERESLGLRVVGGEEE
jgi:hypothetical protein